MALQSSITCLYFVRFSHWSSSSSASGDSCGLDSHRCTPNQRVSCGSDPGPCGRRRPLRPSTRGGTGGASAAHLWLQRLQPAHPQLHCHRAAGTGMLFAPVQASFFFNLEPPGGGWIWGRILGGGPVPAWEPPPVLTQKRDLYRWLQCVHCSVCVASYCLCVGPLLAFLSRLWTFWKRAI